MWDINIDMDSEVQQTSASDQVSPPASLCLLRVQLLCVALLVSWIFHFPLCHVLLHSEAVNADKMNRDTVCRALNQFEISPICHLLVVQPPVDCVCVL